MPDDVDATTGTFDLVGVAVIGSEATDDCTCVGVTNSEAMEPGEVLVGGDTTEAVVEEVTAVPELPVCFEADLACAACCCWHSAGHDFSM